MNYASTRVSRKKRVLRFLGISFIMIFGGLMIVGADQVGHYLQTHRAGYVDENH